MPISGDISGQLKIGVVLKISKAFQNSTLLNKPWGETESKKVVVHEFTHTVTLKLLLDHEPQPVNSKNLDKKFSTFPTWLWESISVYEAQQFVDPKSLPYLNNGQHPNSPNLTIA